MAPVETLAKQRITRRDALRKAAIIGGAVWATPLVQSISMQKAWADHVNYTECPNRYYMKWTNNFDGTYTCDHTIPSNPTEPTSCITSTQLDDGVGEGAPPAKTGGCDCNVTVVRDGNNDKKVIVTFPQACTLDLARLRCGTSCFTPPWTHNTSGPYDHNCGGGDIVYLELIICCDSECAA